MHEIKWFELKRANATDLVQGPCLKVIADGEPLFYLIVKPEGLMRDKVEGLAGLIDSGRDYKEPK